MTPVHPDIANVESMLRKAGLAPPVDRDVIEVRGYLDRITRLIARDSIPLISEKVIRFTVNGREVPCKLYWPDDEPQARLMFYCHGGGFRHGNLAGWDSPLRQIVRDSGLAVLSIDYALSPEYRFPVAFNEVLLILTEVMSQGAIGGCEPVSYALGGDSAGANLALGAAIALRDAGINTLGQLMLFYGVYSKDVTSDSWQRLSGFRGHGLSSESMSTYWKSYLADDEADWRVQPLCAGFDGLPPTRIVVGELDPLLDQNITLGNKLTAAGVKTDLTVLPGIVHGFIRFNEVAPVVRESIRVEAGALREAVF